MRILVISDIHANLTALEAVLDEAEGYETVWCLGDLVGYGPDPNECVARVQALPGLTCLTGNHDQAALGNLDIRSFNPEARRALTWTQQALTDEARAYLAGRPAQTFDGEFSLVHASLRQPLWEYISDVETASQNFPLLKTPYALVGHTHVPVVFRDSSNGAGCDQVSIPSGFPFSMDGQRLILNPGSVGQPRDYNPWAAYALLDQDARTWQPHRTPYDVRAVQARMQRAGLPIRLIARLEAGW